MKHIVRTAFVCILNQPKVHKNLKPLYSRENASMEYINRNARQLSHHTAMYDTDLDSKLRTGILCSMS